MITWNQFHNHISLESGGLFRGFSLPRPRSRCRRRHLAVGLLANAVPHRPAADSFANRGCRTQPQCCERWLTSGSAGASVTAVNMTDALKFEPASLTIAKGTTVTWRNSSQMVHTVTDDPGKASNKADAALPSGAQAWDSGNLNPGQTFSHTFDTPGTYNYFCIPHRRQA